ncbi:MAG: type II toxin-antitoxin system Phd/YefM family antitoxin [Actinomycetes bacterium]
MDQVNVYEAKSQFSALLNRVEGGEEITIARAGHPVARLVPIAHQALPRVPGSCRGQIVMADDFDELPADLLAAFNGQERPSATAS